GIIITRDDIVQVSPVKRRKDSSDSEDDQLASEGKGKEQIVSAADTTPLKKKTGKDKAEVVVKED
ncbi:hypothetical protein A2U01_0096883, partial [Trifolium medium]|nr:hypothetical protein [Trifolium medium]